MAKKNEVIGEKRRVWEVQSQCVHNGEEVWTEEIVEAFVNKLMEPRPFDGGKPALQRYCWCLHDKDNYTEDTFDDPYHPGVVQHVGVGSKKPAHIHLALEFRSAVYNTALQKLTSLPIGCFRKPEAKIKHNQFLAIATYMSHKRDVEQLLGKHLYSVDEIHCSEGFDYERETNLYIINSKKTHSVSSDGPRGLADDMINRIEAGEVDLETAKKEIKERAGYAFYLRYEKEFQLARAEFVKRHYEMKPRINIFLCGLSGSGKSALAQQIALALYPEMSSYECFHTVGAAGVRFDDYEYQPVIIWEDVRASEMLKEYKREGLLNLLEINPKKRSYNIKFGKIILTHKVNIFTDTESFDLFADKLMGEYKDGRQTIEEDKDKEQLLRRFAIVINLTMHDITIKRNDRLYTKGSQKSEFKIYSLIDRINIKDLFENYSGLALQECFQRITAPIVHLFNDYMDRQAKLGDKFYGIDDVPESIRVYEGYEDAMIKARAENEIEYYAVCSMVLPVIHLDGDIEELGPYTPEPEWQLGDELKDLGVYCPITFDQWVDMGRPKNYHMGFYNSDFKGDIQDTQNKRTKDKFDLFERFDEEFLQCAEAKERGESYSLPKGTTEADLDDYRRRYLPIRNTEELLTSPEAVKEYTNDSEWNIYDDDYVETLSKVTDQYLRSKRDEDFVIWAKALLNGRPYIDIISSDAGGHMLDCWHKVKTSWLQSHPDMDAHNWYKAYQKALYQKTDGTKK